MSKTRRFLTGFKKEFNLKDPFIREAPTRDINNLWTKRELGGKGRAVVAASAIGYGAFELNRTQGKLIERDAIAQDPQQLPGTLGDMSEYTPHYLNVDEELQEGVQPGIQPGMGTGVQADGNLVFALHNLRHGG